MQVTVSVGARFHAFDLARQLEKRASLRSLITSYPKFKAAEWGVPREKIRTLLSHELLIRAFRKMRRSDLQFDLNVRYDRIASKHIPRDTDIFVAFSSMALKSIARAQSFGAKAVVERCSTHIAYQDRVLREEYERTGVRGELPDPRTIARECEEYERADYICVPSEFAGRSFVEFGVPGAKVLVCQFGVDAAQFRPAPKLDSTFRVIYCGALSIRKGVAYLLQAFHELRLKNAELWLVGSASPETAAYFKRFESSNIILRGRFPQSELYKQYAQGSVMCMPSIEEGLAMVIPQAMACGLPVVCTYATGARELIREGTDGFVVPPRDVEALKQHLEFLYSRPEQARAMGESARQRILDGYTWDHYGNRIVDFYSRILGAA
jgi:glycosyltransferase involved in cell wall biosynthesis